MLNTALIAIGLISSAKLDIIFQKRLQKAHAAKGILYSI
jgi:hypothetical protein